MISQVVIFAAIASLAAASVATVVDVKAPQPYKFGYNIKDKTSQRFKQEEGNGAGVVTGRYGFADANGIQYTVNYVADALGFRAKIDTNEPGTANQNPADIIMNSYAPYAGGAVPVAGYGGVPASGNGLPILGNGVGYGLGYTRYGY